MVCNCITKQWTNVKKAGREGGQWKELIYYG